MLYSIPRRCASPLVSQSDADADADADSDTDADSDSGADAEADADAEPGSDTGCFPRGSGSQTEQGGLPAGKMRA